MATDDITTMTSPCPCGKGTIAVTQSMPDHPWVRASQIHYSAELNCADCAQVYAVTEEWHGRYPRLVAKSDLAAKAEAETAVHQARKTVEAQPAIAHLRAAIAAEVDALPTKAAKHRLLQSLGLSGETYQTFIYGPCTGEAYLKSKRADAIVKAAHKLNLPVDTQLLAKIKEVEELQQAAWNVRVTSITTNAMWMAT